MSLSVIATQVESRHCVTVLAEGPRGGEQVYCVHFDRHDRPKHAFCEKGPLPGYLGLHLVPKEIVSAAEGTER